ATALSNPSVEARPVKLLHLLPALLSDLLVEVGSVTLRGRLATLLDDLLVKLRAVPLRRRRASAATCLGDSHRSLVPRHRVTLSGPSEVVVCCPGQAARAAGRRMPALVPQGRDRVARRAGERQRPP